MTALRHAAGLKAIPTTTHQATVVASPLESGRLSTAAEGGVITSASNFAADHTTVTGEDGLTSAAGSNHDGNCTGTPSNDNVVSRADEYALEPECSGDADPDRTDATASRKSETVEDQSSVDATNEFSPLATRMLRTKPGDGKSKVGKAAAVVSSVAGRGRREEARRRAELYEVCPFEIQACVVCSFSRPRSS